MKHICVPLGNLFCACFGANDAIIVAQSDATITNNSEITMVATSSCKKLKKKSNHFVRRLVPENLEMHSSSFIPLIIILISILTFIKRCKEIFNEFSWQRINTFAKHLLRWVVVSWLKEYLADKNRGGRRRWKYQT